jgi:hypothetical protein
MSKNLTYTNTVFILSVFCFVQILPISAEVQPFAMVLAALYLIINKKNLRFKIYYPIFALIVMSLVPTIDLILNYKISIYAALSSLVGLTAGPLIMTFFYYKGVPSVKLFKKILIFLAVFGIIQMYFPEILDITGITSIISHLIPRFSSSALSDWQRGITLLAPEPANMAPILFMLITVYLIYIEQHKFSVIDSIFLITSFAFLIYSNKSVSLYVPLMLLIFIYIITKYKFILIFNIIIILLFSLISLQNANIEIFSEESRFQNLSKLFEESTFLHVFSIIDLISGSRFSVMLISLMGYDNFYPAIGGWELRFLEYYSKIDYELPVVGYFERIGGIQPVKPGSLFALAIIDFGAWGFLYIALIYAYIFQLIKYSIIHKISSRIKALLVVNILMTIVGGFPLTLPGYWVSIGVLAHYINSKINYSSNFNKIKIN